MRRRVLHFVIFSLGCFRQIFCFCPIKTLENLSFYEETKDTILLMSWWSIFLFGPKQHFSKHLPHTISTTETLEKGVKCLKLTIKTPERSQWCWSCVFIVNFEHISHRNVSIIDFEQVFVCWLLSKELWYQLFPRHQYFKKL